MMRRRAGAESGMTLMELLVGLVITGLVLALGYGALQAAVDHRARVAEATSEVEETVRVRRALTSWLGGARLSLELVGPDYRGVDDLHGAWDDDELRFLTEAPTFLGTSTTVVRLFVDRDDATPERGLVAELTEWRGTRSQRIELVSGAKGLNIRYLSSISEEQIWNDSWVSTTVLPAAVELRLAWAAADSAPPLLRLPVLVPLGSAR